MTLSEANLIPKQNNRSLRLDTALWVAKLLFLLIGIAYTVFMIAQLAFPNLLTLLSSPSQVLYKLRNAAELSRLSRPNNYLLIVVHCIIFIIWKIHTKQMLESPPESRIANTTQEISSPDQPYFETCNTDAASSDASCVENMKVSTDVASPETDCEDYSDSLDATWKLIMNGKSSPERNSYHLLRAQVPTDTRVLRKLETFNEASNTEEKKMRKSKTFRDGNEGWRGRDVLVVSHDELFGKAEAFLKMNYDQMRLQRQESEQRRRQEEMLSMLNAAY